MWIRFSFWALATLIWVTAGTSQTSEHVPVPEQTPVAATTVDGATVATPVDGGVAAATVDGAPAEAAVQGEASGGAVEGAVAAGVASGTSGVVLASRDAEAPAGPGYRLGPNDEVLVSVLDAEEIPDKPLRIDSRGNLSLPLIGRVAAAGLTAEQLEEELRLELGRYLVDPRVTVTLGEVRSQPVSVLGAVNKPGVHQIESAKTLIEILSLAGGLREDAGHTIKVTRRAEQGAIPLPGARADPSGRFTVAEVDVKEVLEARRPEDNIVIEPHDVISVPRAAMVYVIGEVEKSGGFVLEERQSVSVLQALSLAGGLSQVAALGEARILRGEQQSARVEIAVDLKAIMAGKSPDMALEPEDILFVPRSGRRAARQALERAAVGTLSGIAVWRVGAH